MNRRFRLTALAAGLLLAAQSWAAETERTIEEVVVWGSERDIQTSMTSPTSLLTQEDFAAINVATTEDVVKYEPSLIIRRRFIGDSNGTIGVRGSNMFQTSRSMVFADGVPLHYLLQSRWNGAPRWTLISASEIAQAEVIYGPFSAAYSGNAMGGVVVIESAIPQEREFHFDSRYFSQSFDAYGFDETLNGYTTFFSYGDKIGDLSVYLSYNHLDSESQPQNFYFAGAADPASAAPATGAVPGNDTYGNPQLYFGDTGIEDTLTDNYKIKLGYDFGNWSALLNIAYEDRSNVSDQRSSYVRDANGNPVWSGNYIQDGRAFAVPASRMGISRMERDSLNLGLRLRGDLTERSRLELNVSQFSVLRDQTRASARNPGDPAYTQAGQITDFGDTGWQTADLRYIVDDFLMPNVTLDSGLRHESYEMNLDVYSSDNWAAGSKDRYSNRSGGETAIAAAYTQATWLINQQWDATLGLRYERWESRNGYYSDDDPATPEFDLVNAPENSHNEFSPKLSVGYQPTDEWSFRYSLARAWRFPIVEELFSQYQAYNSINEANPDLTPEKGLHQNLTAERYFSNGSIRVNVYTETIEDVIESQSIILPGGTSLTTFVPVDEVQTDGVEFIANYYGLAQERLDLRFNAAWTDSRIKKNQAAPALEGKKSIRMPEWRGNLLATYHLRDNWNIAANVQYASDSFGNIDNADTESKVYGAQDGYTRVGLKSSYSLENGLTLGVGVDNLTDQLSYVAHPWPGRTWYLNVSFSL